MTIQKPITVLSLFDGMACGRIALDRAGIPVGKYYASEIDAPAIEVAMDNWNDITQLGDVTKWREWDIDWASIDLIIGGSPCQGLSFAGKQLAFDDPRSVLFFRYSAILNHTRAANPEVKYLLENVRMKSESSDIISEYLQSTPVAINSASVSAQSRQRLYWANWEFQPPAEISASLNSILEGPYWSNREKSYCIDANYFKGGNFRRYFYGSSRQIVFKNGYTIPEDMTKETANEIMHRDGNPWRLLTPTECEKMQTVPVGYTESAKKSQRYKMLGNGWTVDVISHILSSMPTSVTYNDTGAS